MGSVWGPRSTVPRRRAYSIMLKSELAVRSELNHWRLRIEPRRLSHWVDVSNPLTSGSYASLPEASAPTSSVGAGILIYLRPFKDIKATICIPNIWMVGLQHRLGMWPIAHLRDEKCAVLHNTTLHIRYCKQISDWVSLGLQLRE